MTHKEQRCLAVGLLIGIPSGLFLSYLSKGSTEKTCDVPAINVKNQQFGRGATENANEQTIKPESGVWH